MFVIQAQSQSQQPYIVQMWIDPLKILSEGQWGREIEGGVYGSQGATPDTPLGLKTVSLPIFMLEAGKGPVTIHLQYSGLKVKQGRHNYSADLPTIIEVHCPDTVETCGNSRLGQQAFMQLGSDKPSQYDWTEVTKDGQVKYLLVGEKDVKFEMPSDKMTTIYLLFLVPKDIETQYMKATVVYGDYAKKRRQNRSHFMKAKS
ncbi:MAG: hypothetical protein H7Z73_10180 [Candidatus Saccharibacteria bacterium]|nr:hypothetical protein [Moraxellaceae bacterium]